MADQALVSILRRGTKAWNLWRMGNPDVQADLVKADFEEASLAEVNLSGSLLRRVRFVRADLNTANLSEANLELADFRWADLSRANLVRANLTDADFHKADLTGANLEGANLTRANFEDARLTAANCAEALFHHTRLLNTTLSGALGLSSAHCRGPSEIDADTLRRSGDLPREFLKGCGFTESELALLEKSEYDLFLSYHSAQGAQAQRVRDRAEKIGLKAYMAPKELKGGDDFADEIRQALRRSREVCLLMTPQALSSTWVATEWGAAWVLGKRITPLLLRCDVKELPDRLRRLECKDFHEVEDYLKEVHSRKT